DGRASEAEHSRVCPRPETSGIAQLAGRQPRLARYAVVTARTPGYPAGLPLPRRSWQKARMAKAAPQPWAPARERIGSVAVKLMSVANVWVFRLTGGRLGGTFLRGAPVCLVTVIGRRTGQPHTVPLLYLRRGDDLVIVASKGGMSHHPVWYHNMIANP